MREIARRVNVTPFAPVGATDVVKAFVRSQYGDIRLPLFHARKSTAKLPHEGLDEEDVAKAYASLTGFCREVLNTFYPLGGRSGMVPNEEFQKVMTKEFSHSLRCVFLDDPSPLDPEHPTVITPKPGFAVARQTS